MTMTEWFIIFFMSLLLIIRFSLSNEDLITAYNAQLDHICKPFVRHAVVTVGLVLLFAPLALIALHIIAGLGFLYAVSIVLGLILLRAWLVVPFIRRWKIHNENGAAKMIRVIIDEDAITEETGDGPKDVRGWAEIDRIVENQKGIIVYFHDRPLMWLPVRIFEDRDALDEFLSLAGRKQKL